MKTTLALLLAVWGVLASLASATTTTTTTTKYDILHRISSVDDTPNWTLRATLDLSTLDVEINKSSLAIKHVLENKLTSQQVEQLKSQAYNNATGKWYQVGLKPSLPNQQDQQDKQDKQDEQVELTTSIPLCHLQQSHPDLININDQLSLTIRSTRSTSTSTSIWHSMVTSLSYRILDITLDTYSCPIISTSKLTHKRANQLERHPIPATESQSALFHTQLTFNHPKVSPQIQLKLAQPTNQDGSLQIPPKEKNLFQKYWFVLIPIALLLFLPDEQATVQGAEAHPSSNHPGTGLGAKKLN